MKRKQILCLLPAVIICAFALAVSAYAASGNVAVNYVNFPDDIFCKYVSSKFDTDSDGSLSATEIAGVTEIDVGDKGIESLEGIEYFTALKELACEENELYSIDLSNNTALTSLDCYNSQLTRLDLSKNTALTWLDCEDNSLTLLDVSNNTLLTYLECSGNNLTTLDVSANTSLTELWCSHNRLTTLDLSKNTALTKLCCSSNRLTTLDLNKNAALTWLNCSGNQLTSLDISGSAVSSCYATTNARALVLDIERKFDLSQLPEFEVDKASNWTGGTVDGQTLTVDNDTLTVTYVYDIGREKTETFTLNFTAYTCPSGQHDYGAYTVISFPTATTDGQEAATCSVCGNTATREIPAYAGTEASVTVAGVKLTKDAPYYVNENGSALTYDGLTDGAYNAYYDAENRALTIQNLEIDNYTGNGIDADGALTLILRGTNSIRLWCSWNNTRNYNTGILTDTLIIQGNGSLSFGAGSEQAFRGSCITYGIIVDELYMKSGSVTVEYSYSTGVIAHELLQISGGSLTVDGPGEDAFCARHIVISGGTLTGYTSASIEHSDWSEDCHAVNVEPEFSGCGTYTITAGNKPEGVEATFVSKGSKLTRYRYLKITTQDINHTLVNDTAIAPDCTTAGLTAGQHCVACNSILTPRVAVEALGHNFGEYVETATPTCTTKGEKTAICGRCGTTDNIELPALGHTEVIDKAEASTCTVAGKTEGSHCSVCGEVIVAQTEVAATGHTEEIIPAVEATTKTTGLTEGKKCSVCGAILVEQQTVPKKNITVNPIGVNDGAYTVEGTVVTVKYDKPCKVGYLGEDGAYVALEATANGDGSYSFEAPDGVTEVIIVIKGDVNSDGNVDGSDVTQLKAAFLGKRELTAAEKFAGDIDGENGIAGNDVTQLKAAFLGKKALSW